MQSIYILRDDVIYQPHPCRGPPLCRLSLFGGPWRGQGPPGPPRGGPLPIGSGRFARSGGLGGPYLLPLLVFFLMFALRGPLVLLIRARKQQLLLLNQSL